MGGFLLAAAMEQWGLHKRVALHIMALVGTSPARLVLGFMVATAFISMWISNTATAAMMLPMALAVGELLRPKALSGPYNFGIALMLGVAYGASIGGVATLIGTPPNAVFAGAASELLDIEIGFLQWMGVGLPIVIVLLPVTWLVLLRLHPPGQLEGDASRVIDEERSRLGLASRGERTVAAVFALTALAWVLRAEKTFGSVTIPGIETFAPSVEDSTIAMGAAVLLFLLPVDWRRGEFALEWRMAKAISWDVLVLFGGGLSLARAMEASGLATWIGGVISAVGDVPPIVIVLVVVTLIVFLTEVTSNTATATMAMPIMAGAATGLGMDPLLPMAAAALSASMAFMLPVATPPNAMVFASGYISIPQMSRVGFWLNLCSIALITLLGTLLIQALLM
jgi:sodium-dependent dicarboxylate transporter 2/3/5